MLRSLLTAASFILAVVWNYSLHVLDHLHHSVPYWLNALQSFWLGGLGFSCSIVWYPFIKRSLMQVSSDFIERIATTRRQHVKVISRMQLQPIHRPWDQTDTADIAAENPPIRTIYTIPSRWQDETVNTYRGPTSNDPAIDSI